MQRPNSARILWGKRRNDLDAAPSALIQIALPSRVASKLQNVPPVLLRHQLPERGNDRVLRSGQPKDLLKGGVIDLDVSSHYTTRMHRRRRRSTRLRSLDIR